MTKWLFMFLKHLTILHIINTLEDIKVIFLYMKNVQDNVWKGEVQEKWCYWLTVGEKKELCTNQSAFYHAPILFIKFV